MNRYPDPFSRCNGFSLKHCEVLYNCNVASTATWNEKSELVSRYTQSDRAKFEDMYSKMLRSRPGDAASRVTVNVFRSFDKLQHAQQMMKNTRTNEITGECFDGGRAILVMAHVICSLMPIGTLIPAMEEIELRYL